MLTRTSLTRRLAVPTLIIALTAFAGGAQPLSNALPGKWTGSMQSGLAEAMQLSLGGLFNPGPAFQNRLTIQGTGVAKRGDVVQLYGWSTTDLRKDTTDADIGLRYRVPIAKVGGGTFVAGSGLEYWHFPSVLGGQRDLAVDSYVSWSGGEKVPITVSANGKTILRSRLPHGTMGIFQVQHSKALYSWKTAALSLQHGPIYVYNWNLYGKNGHRVLRYCGSLQFGGKTWAVEAMYRPQMGLQGPIANNRFWSFSVIRRFGL